MAVWFTSDTHFGDRRALNIDRRPYPDLAAHDAGLIANWNERIAPDDTVWHLGDVALGPSDTRIAEIVGSLNGVKHLIIGNNDGPGTLVLQDWASVGHYAEIDVDGRRLVLCHYAFRTWNRIGRGALNLHGHSHGKLAPAPRQYDVGVDVHACAPVRLDEILVSRRRRKPAEPSP